MQHKKPANLISNIDTTHSSIDLLWSSKKIRVLQNFPTFAHHLGIMSLGLRYLQRTTHKNKQHN